MGPRYWIAGAATTAVIEVSNLGKETAEDLVIRIEAQPKGRILRHGAVERRLTRYFTEGLTELECAPEKEEVACDFA